MGRTRVWMVAAGLSLIPSGMAYAQSGAAVAAAHEIVTGQMPCPWRTTATVLAACVSPEQFQAMERQFSSGAEPAPAGQLGCRTYMRAMGGGGHSVPHPEERPLDVTTTRRDRAQSGHETHCCYTHNSGCVNPAG